MDDVYENLDEMTAEKAAEALGISQKRYANMRTDERHDYAYEVFHGHDAAIGEFMGLPTETDVPDDIDTDEDSVGDYLSDESGYCHRGFVVDSNKKNNDAATYEELAAAYRKSGHVVFVMALNTLISMGRDTVANMKHPAAISATIQGNTFLCQVGTKKILRIYKPFIGGQPPVNGLRFLYALLPFFVRRFLYAASNASIIGVTGSSLSGLDRYSNRMPFSRNFRSNLMKEEVSRLIREVSRVRIVPMS